MEKLNTKPKKFYACDERTMTVAVLTMIKKPKTVKMAKSRVLVNVIQRYPLFWGTDTTLPYRHGQTKPLFQKPTHSSQLFQHNWPKNLTKLESLRCILAQRSFKS